MTEEVIPVKYLEQTIRVKRPPTFEDFISQLVDTFFLTENMKNNINLKYIDDDGDEIPVDNDEYTSLNNENTLILTIPEIEKPDGENINIDVNKSLKKMKKDYEDYKKKLVEISQNIINKKLKEVDKKNKEEIEEINKKYENCLKKIKEVTQSQINNLLSTIEQKCEEIMDKELTEYNNYIEKKLLEVFQKINDLLEKKDNEINIGLLEDKQNEVTKVLENNKEELDKAINN